jgi:hypothetical protein
MDYYFNKLFSYIKFIKNYFISLLDYFRNFNLNVFLVGDEKFTFNEREIFKSYEDYSVNKNIYKNIFLKNFFNDFFVLFFNKINYKNYNNFNNNFRSNFRLIETKNNFYFNLNKFNNNKNHLNFLKNFNLSGYFYILNFIKL